MVCKLVRAKNGAFVLADEYGTDVLDNVSVTRGRNPLQVNVQTWIKTRTPGEPELDQIRIGVSRMHNDELRTCAVLYGIGEDDFYSLRGTW